MNISIRIKQCRADAGWTLQELADRIGTSKSYVWEMENRDKDISLRIVLKLADVFCMNIQQFLYASDQPSTALMLIRDVRAAVVKEMSNKRPDQD